MPAQIIKMLVITVVFILGLLFTSKPRAREGFGSNCPNLLIKKDGAYYLKNTLNPASPPIKFVSLDDYGKFVDQQRIQGITCPILFLQQTADAQGSMSYRMMPDPRAPEGGLSVEQFPEKDGELKRKLIDASRLGNLFNRGLYPGYDPMNQDIGVETPLDKIFTSYGPVSDNPMDANWGGVSYTNTAIQSGKYDEDNVKIWTA
jgi:hypothetical protein